MAGVSLISSTISPSLPFIISFSLAAIVLVTKKPNISLKIPPLLIAVTLFYLLIISIIIFSYPTLPDSDPYTWLDRTNKFFETKTVDTLVERPLFYYLDYIISVPMGIKPYVAFKYIFPFAPLLALPSLWLVSRRLQNKIQQVAFLLTPMLSASTLLYFTTPIPQSIIMVILVIFFCWLVYADYTQKRIWYYASGALMAAGYLYHESALLLFLAWALITSVTSAKSWYAKIRNNHLAFILAILLILTNIHILYKPTSLIRYWTTTAWAHIGEINLLFPASYINIDGRDVGWGNLTGVTKYYLYYAGPPVLLILFFTVFAIGKIKEYRRFLIDSLRSSPASKVILLSIIIFFSLSEIIPRLLNIAFLPERAWIFTGTFSMYLFISYIFYAKTIGKIASPALSLSLVFLTCISVGAALYINQGKVYSIPSNQLRAANWVKDNLPKNRIMMTTRNGNLLTFHSLSNTVLVDPQIFCADQNGLNSIISKISQVQFSTTDTLPERSPLEELRQYLNTNQKVSIQRVLELAQLSITSEHIPLAIDNVNLHHFLYVFFAKMDDQNLYGARPYFKTDPLNNCNQPTLNKYPNVFEQVYNDDERIIIWAVK
ncbi:MAG: hypothetical protein A3E36_02145 [Candidatus Andersenbacteria bacterium RIFCSPHIGHO2_12_FULL_45_11b]|uniref:Glycosyltransferase RgtA/B/C/D-like domain-containing protein n=1 Tax=Candidatus Andersenbacteria bacterium RIFCSPHIGHO2_12_FULL_45_11b TaxID=1797282 RepID=A0A1G1XB48_9BACT|nr:MAG: hypothetical protein A3E36_02145 [Candidatus Andersenbacteria bacterium RIFCSPHIGHO2_12_FULL_45_11b]